MITQITGIYKDDRQSEDALLKKLETMKTYYDLKDKSKKTDEFMEDVHELRTNIQAFKKYSFIHTYLDEGSDSIYHKSEGSDS